ncbi:piggyBac transposable element-derived protein 3 [Trichonephila clavipes]|nr:piggyBac transposable element-derived protein 3 [Trichonephila clavipes]
MHIPRTSVGVVSTPRQFIIRKAAVKQKIAQTSNFRLPRERNINLAGTVMTNRTDGVAGSFPKDTDMERGSSVSRRREDGKACLVKWKDKTYVLLLSSAFGIKPEGSRKRTKTESRCQTTCHCKVI